MLPILIGMAIGGFVGHVVNETAQNKKLEDFAKDLKSANNEKGGQKDEPEKIASVDSGGVDNGVDS